MAWNGLRLAAPAHWNVVRLGFGYLYFEDVDGPVFELKWRRGAGREGMRGAVRTLAPKGQATGDAVLPRSWAGALASFETMPLSWRREGRTGTGAALCCPQCGLAAVFQAYGGADGLDRTAVDTVAAVLRSWSHHEPDPPAFRLYGFACVPPAGFTLRSFAFVPGRFMLSFAASRRRRLDIVRLAPAEVLLAANDLATVAARALGFETAAGAMPGEVAGAPAVWLGARQGGSLGARVLRWCGRTGRLGVLRHQVADDKLIGVAASAPHPVDRAWLAEVATRCVSV